LAESPNQLYSLFLGPQGDNEQLLRELIESALQSHLEWRRAYHPEDSSPIPALEQKGWAGKNLLALE